MYQRWLGDNSVLVCTEKEGVCGTRVVQLWDPAHPWVAETHDAFSGLRSTLPEG